MKQQKSLVLFSALFLAITVAYSAIFSLLVELFQKEDIPVDFKAQTLIILDAGHGGEDGGATGTNGVLEKDLNLLLTSALADLLRLSGYSVLESRTEDKLLYDEGTKKGHKKQSDLQNRLKLTEQYPESVFISIHMNTFPSPDCTGTQIWYSENDPESAEWAKAMQNKIQNTLQPENNRKIKAATSNIYILRHAATPAILIECGFISSPTECERLCDPVYQKKLVATLFSVIDEKMRAES